MNKSQSNASEKALTRSQSIRTNKPLTNDGFDSDDDELVDDVCCIELVGSELPILKAKSLIIDAFARKLFLVFEIDSIESGRLLDRLDPYGW